MKLNTELKDSLLKHLDAENMIGEEEVSDIDVIAMALLTLVMTNNLKKDIILKMDKPQQFVQKERIRSVPMKHQLKIAPMWLDAKLKGNKLFEIRLNDRDYQVGDIIVYNEQLIGGGFKTHWYEITFVTEYQQMPHFVVFGERKIERQ